MLHQLISAALALALLVALLAGWWATKRQARKMFKRKRRRA